MVRLRVWFVVSVSQMKVRANISALSRVHWYEYLPRFLFGGAVTAFAGIVAKKYGPSMGGLFLAFPAIFPATATLVANHEEKKRRKRGQPASSGKKKGRKQAGLDAAGASMGAFGLLAFALLVWKLISLPLWSVLLIATVVWFLVSVLAWKLR
jgi:hypothetical protein